MCSSSHDQYILQWLLNYVCAHSSQYLVDFTISMCLHLPTYLRTCMSVLTAHTNKLLSGKYSLYTKIMAKQTLYPIPSIYTDKLWLKGRFLHQVKKLVQQLATDFEPGFPSSLLWNGTLKTLKWRSRINGGGKHYDLYTVI